MATQNILTLRERAHCSRTGIKSTVSCYHTRYIQIHIHSIINMRTVRSGPTGYDGCGSINKDGSDGAGEGERGTRH